MSSAGVSRDGVGGGLSSLVCSVVAAAVFNVAFVVDSSIIISSISGTRI
ncbi:unnamed protein product [Tenebrio molitor]|nr:unnamed protein product [Tenebrio molitor]